MYIPKLSPTFEKREVSPGRFVLKNVEQRHYLEIGEEEYFLLQSMDGNRDLEELSLLFYEKFHYIGYNRIVAFFHTLFSKGFLLSEPPGYAEKKGAPHAHASSAVHLPLVWKIDLTTMVTRLATLPLKFMYTPGLFWPLAVLATLLIPVFFLLDAGDHYRIFSYSSGIYFSLAVTTLIVVSSGFIYSLAGAMALRAAQRDVNDVSVFFLGFIPFFRCRKDDILMEGLNRRLVTYAAGSVTLFCIAAPATVLLILHHYKPAAFPLFASYPQTGHILFKISTLPTVIGLLALSPFFPSDGVRIFREVFHFSFSREHLTGFIQNFFRVRRAGGKVFEQNSRRDVGISVAITWLVVSVFALSKGAVYLLNEEAKVVFANSLFSPLPAVRYTSFGLFALLVIPPLLLFAYALLQLHIALFKKSLELPALSAIFLAEALALTLLPANIASCVVTISGIILACMPLMVRHNAFSHASPTHGYITSGYAVLVLALAGQLLLLASSAGLLSPSAIGEVRSIGFLASFGLGIVFLAAMLFRFKGQLYMHRGLLAGGPFFAALSFSGDYPPPAVGGFLALLCTAFAVAATCVRIDHLHVPEIPLREEFSSPVEKFSALVAALHGAVFAPSTKHKPLRTLIASLRSFLGPRMAFGLIERALCKLPLTERVSLTPELQVLGISLPSGAPRTEEDVRAAIKAIPLFARATEDERDALLTHLKSMPFAPGDLIIREGDVGDKFFTILRGEVEVAKLDSHGFQTKVGRLFAGDSFGEIALLSHVPRTASIIGAGNGGELLYLDREPFERLTEAFPDFKTRLENTIRQANLLRNVSIFNSLTSNQIFNLATTATRRPTLPGDFAIKEGDDGQEFFVVLSGKYDVVRGREQLTTLGSGNFFGEVALLKDVTRTASVKTRESGELLVINKGDFLDALAGDTTLLRKFQEVSHVRDLGGA